jgi:L-threonylcarbamoyladenylate synthase
MFEGRLSLVLDGGASTFGLESTIVSIQGGRTFVHRHGAISVEELIDVVGMVYEKNKDGVIDSPGQLPYHYAPHKPLTIISGLEEIRTAASSLLAFRTPPKTPLSRHMKILSPAGDLREAAANFFSYLIELDRDDIDIIYAEQVPEAGLGKAMMERLKKAAKKRRVITR